MEPIARGRRPSSGTNPPPALEVRGLSKAFGPARAVDDVSLAIPSGSISGVIGENGAGKTTLMNLVYGLHQADDGEVLVDGEELRLSGPREALRRGIGMVHQHFMLVETFTVLQNVVLGAEGGALLGSNLAKARVELLRISDQFGFAVDADALVGDLPVGEQQRIEVLKALYRRARILIFDEPTAVLTPQETDRLFTSLRELAAGGVTIILITHKLREIMAVTDRVFVMRRGRLVAERDTSATTPAELAELMIGGALPAPPPRARTNPGAALLSCRGLAVADPTSGRPVLADIDLDLRAGEIVGIAGVSGNGQSELLEALTGMRALSAGRLTLGAHEVTPERPLDAAGMRRLGVAHVPEHRHRHGLVNEFEAAETAILGYHRTADLGGILLDPGAVERRCADLMRRFDVRPLAPRLRSSSFSGGNQQKLVMAREVGAGPRILLVGQPTRGVDIGAIAFIHAEILAMREAGCAILVVSTELDEIIALADRILVMAAGRITGEFDASAADPATLGLMMSGTAAQRPHA